MVPTRQSSAWYRRRICARSSGAMVMAGAMPKEPEAHARHAAAVTPVTLPGCPILGGGGRRGSTRRVDTGCRDAWLEGGRHSGGRHGWWRASQYSIRRGKVGTLMRHRLPLLGPALSPTPGAPACLYAPSSCLGSARRRRAATRGGPRSRIRRRSSDCHGRSRCRSEPGRGNARTGRVGQVYPPRPPPVIRGGAGRDRPRVQHCCSTRH